MLVAKAAPAKLTLVAVVLNKFKVVLVVLTVSPSTCKFSLATRLLLTVVVPRVEPMPTTLALLPILRVVAPLVTKLNTL